MRTRHSERSARRCPTIGQSWHADRVFVWIVECAQSSHSFVGSVWSTYDGAMSWLERSGGCGSCTVTMAEVDTPFSVE